MKTKEIINMLIGIVVGTVLGLFLTLHLWGDAWWQIIIAIFIGGNVGCLITDAKLFWKMMLKSYETAQTIFESVGNLKIKKRSRKKINKRRLIYAIHNWLLFLLCVVVAFIVAYINNIIQVSLWLGILDIYLLILLVIVFVNVAIFSNSIYMVSKNRKDIVYFLNNEYREGRHSVHAINHEYNNNISIGQFFRRLWLVKLWDALFLIILIPIFVFNISISIISLIIFLIILPFILLKKLLSQNKFLFVFIGVTISIIIGTISGDIFLGLITSVAMLPPTILLWMNYKFDAGKTFPIKIMSFFWSRTKFLNTISDY